MENEIKKASTHHNLDLWKESLKFVARVYQITETFPKEERFALSGQMRRAGISICSNIAEGAARGHKKEFVQFLFIAQGSVSEIETQLEIAVLLGYLKSFDGEKITIKRLRMMIRGLIRKINS